jgi:hypothetical protein
MVSAVCDDAYRREGTCNLFMCVEPFRGWRHVEVTERRTAQDFAVCLKELVDVHFPEPLSTGSSPPLRHVVNSNGCTPYNQEGVP